TGRGRRPSTSRRRTRWSRRPGRGGDGRGTSRIARSVSRSRACLATSRASSSIRPSTSSTRSWRGRATAGGSPPRSGGGRMATVLEPEAIAAPREQARARYPDTTGFVERDGVRVFYEVYGSGEPTILLLPTWSIIHSRFWKMQIPDLARRHRVITFDGRGNGRSDRPGRPDAYAEAEFAADAVAVMDATGTERAVVMGLSMGAMRGLLLATDHADRVAGIVFIGPSLALQPRP